MGKPVQTFTVKSEAELEGALAVAERTEEFTIIELMLDKLDAPQGLKRMGPKTAAFDFGERGPTRGY
jgi:TPP-dependent 2-oxoacid decarboxylase